MTDREDAIIEIECAMETLGVLELPLPVHRWLEAALTCLNGALEELARQKTFE